MIDFAVPVPPDFVALRIDSTGSRAMSAKFTLHYPGEDAAKNSLDVARDTFTWLVTGPNPVSVNGRLFPDLPNRLIPLDELRDRLLASGCSQITRDTVWAHLVLRARAEGATWTVAAVGVALPALVSAAATLSNRFAGDPADVHSEVLRGFLTALPFFDLRPPRIVLRLRWAAYRTGYSALTEALASPIPVAPGFRSARPHPPSGHPDLVLARAVASGVLTRTEADLIGSTRLEGVAVADWAAQHKTGEWAVYKTRKRAELRLLTYLREESSNGDPTDPLIDQVAASLSLTRGSGRVTRTANSSPSVSAGEADSKRKVRKRVSKPDSKTGVQGSGNNPPPPDLRRSSHARDRRPSHRHRTSQCAAAKRSGDLANAEQALAAR